MNASRLAGLFAYLAVSCLATSGGHAAADPPFDPDGARAPTPARAAGRLHAPVGTAADWQPLGPPGGDVTDVSASPTTPGVLLAGTAPGASFGGSLYRSTDGGASWSAVADLAGTSVFAIVFGADGRAHAATQDGVWSSDDDGANWTQHDLGIDPLNDVVFDIAVDPADPAKLWIGVSAAWGQQSVNLMRSDDGGQSWQDRTPPLAAPSNGAGVAVDPSDPSRIAAAFHGDFDGGEVWVSEDGGDTWEDRSAGLPGTPVNAVAWNGARLLAGGGMLFGSQDFGLYASDDLGQTWTALHDAAWPLLIVTAIAIDPNDAQTIAVATDGTGIHRTHDGGASWDLGVGGSDALAAQSVRYAPGHSQELLVGANSLGVFLSHDGGGAFDGASNGISELSLYSIAANPLDAQELAAAFQGNNSGGVFRSVDGGATWSLEDVPPTRYSQVGFSPAGGLYAISSGPSSVAPEGLYRRESDGHWTGLGPDQGDRYESDLAALRFSASDPDLILLGGADFGVAGNEGTIWRSTDAGQSWVKHEFEAATFVSDLEIVGDAEQVVVAPYTGSETPDQGGVLRSTDAGESWSVALERSTYSQRPRLCASAGQPQTLFLALATDWSAGGVLRSEDDGATWSPTSWQGTSVVDVACDPSDADVLYLAQAGGGARVVRSSDRGESAAPFDTGLDAAGWPRELAFAGDAHLLLASSKGSYATPLENSDGIFADGFD